MNVAPRRLGPWLLGAAVLGSLGGAPTAVFAGDVTAFVAISAPAENWSRGYGAALSSTWFQVVSFEAEAARIPGDSSQDGMTTFTGSALLAPPIGILIPYGGIGAGLFRQTRPLDSDLGTLRCFILGAKLKLGPVLVVKGEYRAYQLSGTPLLAMERRLSAGAGISF